MFLTPLTADHARRLIGDIFIYYTPFNRELSLKLTQHENDAAQLESRAMKSWWATLYSVFFMAALASSAGAHGYD